MVSAIAEIPRSRAEVRAFRAEHGYPATGRHKGACVGWQVDHVVATLAITFARGAGAIYHYPDVELETAEAFKGAEPIGSFFSQNIEHLPFVKYPAEAQDPPATATATAISGESSR